MGSGRRFWGARSFAFCLAGELGLISLCLLAAAIAYIAALALIAFGQQLVQGGTGPPTSWIVDRLPGEWFLLIGMAGSTFVLTEIVRLVQGPVKNSRRRAAVDRPYASPG